MRQSRFFNKVAGLRPATLLKKRLWHRCFPVNFTKVLRIPFLHNISARLLLKHTFCVSSHSSLSKSFCFSILTYVHTRATSRFSIFKGDAQFLFLCNLQIPGASRVYGLHHFYSNNSKNTN